MIIQHIGGVTTLLKGLRFNPSHRKFAIIVANLGRFLVVFGLILAKKEQTIIIGAAAIASILFVITVGYYRQYSKAETSQAQRVSSSSQAERQRSPPRDVKRD